MTNSEKVARLQELFDEFDIRISECRRLIADDVESHIWLREMRYNLYGLSSPSMQLTILKLRESEAV